MLVGELLSAIKHRQVLVEEGIIAFLDDELLRLRLFSGGIGLASFLEPLVCACVSAPSQLVHFPA